MHRYRNSVVRNERLFWEEILWGDDYGHEYAASLKDEAGVVHDCGSWPSLREAGEHLRLMAEEIAGEESVRRGRMLHLYLRHRRDKQAYGNEWIGDFRLASITTYEAVANLCRAAMEAGGRVRVHRRKFEHIPATVCCECSVKAVTPIPPTNGFKVEFSEWISLSVAYDKRLQKGYYFADPADYEPAPEEGEDP